MSDNPFESETPSWAAGPAPPPAAEPRPSGPEINWQGPAANFAAQQAWKEYGGTSQLDKETEIPNNIKVYPITP